MLLFEHNKTGSEHIYIGATAPNSNGIIEHEMMKKDTGKIQLVGCSEFRNDYHFVKEESENAVI